MAKKYIEILSKLMLYVVDLFQFLRIAGTANISVYTILLQIIHKFDLLTTERASFLLYHNDI